MASLVCKGLIGILHRSQGNAALKSLFNFKRTLSIPPLNTPSRDAEVDGLYFGNKESQKIYEIRTYTVRPKDYKEYIKFTEDNFHLRIKHSKLFGFWSTELGALNEIVHIWEYDNHDHRAKVRQALAADAEWQSNYISKVAPMWISQTNATMMLLPWSIITLPSKSGVYELQIFNMNSHTDIWDGRLKAAMELSSLKLKSSNSVLIACFTSIFGPHNTVYALWQHESFDKFAFGRLQLLSDTNKSVYIFNMYFPENYENENWIRNPFCSNVSKILSREEKKQLIEIFYDHTLAEDFKNSTLANFWLNRKKEELKGILSEAIKFSLPFCATYFCEKGVSSLLYLKNNCTTKLKVDPNLQLKLNEIRPDIKKLIFFKQAQILH